VGVGFLEAQEKIWSNNTFLRCFTVSIGGEVWRFVPMVMVVEKGDATALGLF
jgi:hypothetical protein